MKKWLQYINPLTVWVSICFAMALFALLGSDIPGPNEDGPSVGNEGAALLALGFGAPAFALQVYTSLFVKDKSTRLILTWGVGGIYLIYMLWHLLLPI
jgi:hypothetical protein